MGINISVIRGDDTCDPDWDKIRYAGDRDFYYSDGFDWEYKPYDENAVHDMGKRPKDIRAARKWVFENPELSEWSKDRLTRLLQILDDHPDWWISG